MNNVVARNEDPTGRVAELERRLVARDETVATLMKRLDQSDAEGREDRRRLSLEHWEEHGRLEQALAELKSMQAQLLQAQKLEAIGQLAAGVAHEINTPTQYVTDNTEFLQRSFTKLVEAVDACRALMDAVRSGAPPEETAARAEIAFTKAKATYFLKQVPRALDQSLEGLRRIAKIVAAMKDFSHPSGGEKAPVDLRDAIASTIIVATNEWKYVAEIETDFEVGMPAVSCMRDEINQVVLNLLVNAAHAIAATNDNGALGKGVIRVETRHAGGWAEIRIGDTGRGIPANIRGRIFDPFFTTKPVGKGTGQGLAIAYSVVVDKHGGHIDFDTEEGVGTTFVIRLPMVASMPPSFRPSMRP